MSVQWLTDSQRERLSQFPDTLEHDGLATFFTLSYADKARISVCSGRLVYGNT